MGKVVSILSAGHSGSTLLDMVCGSISGVFSLGEVTYLPWQINRTRDEEGSVRGQNICTCRKKFQRCPVWSKVIAHIGQLTNIDMLRSPFDFRISLLMSQRYENRLLHPVRVIRYLLPKFVNHGWTNVVAQVVCAKYRSAAVNNWLLFDTVSDSQNTPFVVDSTKDSLHLWLLHQHRPLDTRAIVLFRDIRAVVYSDIRRYKGDPLKRANGWVRVYNRILRMLQAMPELPIKIVHYEDLCTNPETTRAKVAEFLDLPHKARTFPLDSKTYHMVAGNPMRYKDNIEIRYDDEWRKKLDNDIENQILTIAGHLNTGWKELGYTGFPF